MKLRTNKNDAVTALIAVAAGSVIAVMMNVPEKHGIHTNALLQMLFWATFAGNIIRYFRSRRTQQNEN